MPAEAPSAPPRGREGVAQHTPGPWKYYEITPTLDGIGYIRPDPEDGREIAHHGDESRSAEENRANARLISAAPDLLAALHNLVPRFAACCRHAGNTQDTVDASTEQARAAIAKATTP
jgi:hypothetical protein